MKTKPRHPVLQRGHPLARGLAHYFPLHDRGGNAIRDLVTGREATNSKTSAYGWEMGELGSQLNLGDDADRIFSIAAGPEMTNVTSWSMVLMVKASASSVNGAMFGVTTDLLIFYPFDSDYDGQRTYFAGSSITSTTGAYADGAFHVFVITCTDVGTGTHNLALYRDGYRVPGVFNPTTTKVFANGGGTITIGGGFGQTEAGTVGMCALYNRPLCATEVLEISQDPWSLVTPRRRLPAKAPTAGVVGAGGVTVPSATVAGVGKLTYQGTGGVTVPSATVVGVGKLTYQGAGGVVVPAATVAGAGIASTSITGSGGVVVPSATVAGAGSVTPPTTHDGTGGVTVPAATIAGVGKLTYQGAGGVVVPSATVAGAGTASTSIVGSGGVTVPLPTINGAGKLTYRGSGGVVVPAATIAGVGTASSGTTGVGAYGTPMSSIGGSLLDPAAPALGTSLTVGSFADRMLARAAALTTSLGNTATFEHPIGRVYRPTGGTTSQTGTTSVTCRVSTSGTVNRFAGGAMHKESDMSILVSAKLLGFKPLPGTTTVTMKSRVFTITEVHPLRAQNFDIAYKVRVR